MIKEKGINDLTLIAECAEDRHARLSCEALYERWKKLAIVEISARTGQNFLTTERPGQPDEPELVSRHDKTKNRKGGVAETLGGNLLAAKRHLQALTGHMKQQKGWKGVRSIKLKCVAALCKAKHLANAEQKRMITKCEYAAESDSESVLAKCITELDRMIRAYHSIQWTQSRQDWNAKMRDSITSGDGLIYRTIKERVTGEIPVTKQGEFGTREIVEEQAEIWAAWWQSEGSVQWTDFVNTGTKVPQKLTTECIRAVSASFKSQTSCVDGFHPRHYSLLSIGLLEALVRLFRIFEAIGQWPRDEQKVLTVLIPKAEGGLRPIALFRTLYRMYSRATCINVKKWAEGVNQHRVNNAKNRWVGDSTWRNQVRIANGGSETTVLEAQMDVKKAFENATRHQLVEIAEKVGYPMPELLTSIMAYFWPRHIVYEGVAPRGIVPRSGIAAGSASATFELTALLLPALARMAICDPEASISLHVDDIGATVFDKNRANALVRFENLLAVINGEFAKLKLPLAREKGVVLANTKELAETANRMVGDIAVTTGTQARRLGVDYIVGRSKRATLKVHKRRLNKADTRFVKLRTYARHGAARVFTAGTQSVALYGSEHFEVDKKTIKKLRSQLINCGNINPRNVPHLTTILVYKIEQDPWFTSVAQPLVRWAREIWLATTDWHNKPGDVLSFTELDAAINRIKKITGDDSLTSSKRQRHRQDPVRAAAAALTQLG